MLKERIKASASDHPLESDTDANSYSASNNARGKMRLHLLLNTIAKVLLASIVLALLVTTFIQTSPISLGTITNVGQDASGEIQSINSVKFVKFKPETSGPSTGAKTIPKEDITAEREEAKAKDTVKAKSEPHPSNVTKVDTNEQSVQVVQRNQTQEAPPAGLALSNDISKQVYVTIVDNSTGISEDQVLDLFKQAVSLAKQVRSFDTERSFLLIVPDGTLKRVKREAMKEVKRLNLILKSPSQVFKDLVSVVHVGREYDKGKLYAIQYNYKLLLWSLVQYDQLAYLSPGLMIQKDLGDIFSFCRKPLCAPPLFPSDGTGKVDKRLFHTDIMLVRPNVATVRHFVDAIKSVEATYRDKNITIPEPQRVLGDMDALRLGLENNWEHLPNTYYELQTRNTRSAQEKTKTYFTFEKRILLVSMGSGPSQKELAISSEINQLWCKRHGYEHLEITHRVLPSENFTAHFDRYEILRQHISQYDYVVWMDSDAFINEIGKDIRNIIRTFDNDIIVSSDWEYDSYKGKRLFPPINSGVMIFRNSAWTRDFLEYFLSLQDDYCRACAKKVCPGIAHHDQGCLEHMRTENQHNLRHHIHILPVGVLQRLYRRDHLDGRIRTFYNSNYTLAIHIAGVSRNRKYELMKQESHDVLYTQLTKSMFPPLS